MLLFNNKSTALETSSVTTPLPYLATARRIIALGEETWIRAPIDVKYEIRGSVYRLHTDGGGRQIRGKLSVNPVCHLQKFESNQRMRVVHFVHLASAEQFVFKVCRLENQVAVGELAPRALLVANLSSPHELGVLVQLQTEAVTRTYKQNTNVTVLNTQNVPEVKNAPTSQRYI